MIKSNMPPEPPEPSTEAQQRTIEKWATEEICEHMKEKYGTAAPSLLTKQQAMEVIDMIREKVWEKNGGQR